jgi:hypothetical protein
MIYWSGNLSDNEGEGYGFKKNRGLGIDYGFYLLLLSGRRDGEGGGVQFSGIFFAR